MFGQNGQTSELGRVAFGRHDVRGQCLGRVNRRVAEVLVVVNVQAVQFHLRTLVKEPFSKLLLRLVHQRGAKRIGGVAIFTALAVAVEAVAAEKEVRRLGATHEVLVLVAESDGRVDARVRLVHCAHHSNALLDRFHGSQELHPFVRNPCMVGGGGEG